MWKILTAHIREEIYYSPIRRGLFSEEQERRLQGIKRDRWFTVYWSAYPQEEQNKVEKRSHNMDWHEKAYDIVPQSWIL